jgi:hypothetical protein
MRYNTWDLKAVYLLAKHWLHICSLQLPHFCPISLPLRWQSTCSPTITGMTSAILKRGPLWSHHLLQSPCPHYFWHMHLRNSCLPTSLETLDELEILRFRLQKVWAEICAMLWLSKLFKFSLLGLLHFQRKTNNSTTAVRRLNERMHWSLYSFLMLMMFHYKNPKLNLALFIKAKPRAFPAGKGM